MRQWRHADGNVCIRMGSIWVCAESTESPLVGLIVCPDGHDTEWEAKYGTDLLEDLDGAPYPEPVQAFVRAVAGVFDLDALIDKGLIEALENMRLWGVVDALDTAADEVKAGKWYPQWGRDDWVHWLRTGADKARSQTE